MGNNSSTNTELDSFVKLGIGYLGIMTGVAMLLATIEKTIPSPMAEVASHRT